jgi:hypothetical protein
MGYCIHASVVRVDRFKQRGKWYESIAVDMSEYYNHPDIHDALRRCLARDGYVIDDWTWVCLEPYHKHSHPIMLRAPEGLS